MGFFENLGRKVGKFTHEAKEAAADEANYACEDCGERFYTGHDECPECGSGNVRELETSAKTKGDGTDSGETAESPTAGETAEPTDASDVNDGTNRE
ncbi:FmdB family zinc ribbon protein [Natronococcus wangiae]|uniref:FmdB family zinc ribbon protein n=1 Tax=Natronococcus wangiae TaxID=3068275 RepID=UPI00273E06C3|nr:zinc ribbon domain-containing protein [Natronococcus sp. AD5]